MINAEGYFGWATINGHRYEKDIIIHVDGSITDRPVGLSLDYREDYFHTPLSERELGFVRDEGPEVIIVGAGYKIMMMLTPQAKEMLAPYEVVVTSTQRALELVREEKRRFVAVLHVTC